ncbi:polyketide synthase [Pseudohyphozyma bogoriensis]|nr:polyketide synthase [Pseudohyphozyma bogoriensis]
MSAEPNLITITNMCNCYAALQYSHYNDKQHIRALFAQEFHAGRLGSPVNFKPGGNSGSSSDQSRNSRSDSPELDEDIPDENVLRKGIQFEKVVKDHYEKQHHLVRTVAGIQGLVDGIVEAIKLAVNRMVVSNSSNYDVYIINPTYHFGQFQPDFLLCKVIVEDGTWDVEMCVVDTKYTKPPTAKMLEIMARKDYQPFRPKWLLQVMFYREALMKILHEHHVEEKVKYWLSKHLQVYKTCKYFKMHAGASDSAFFKDVAFNRVPEWISGSSKSLGKRNDSRRNAAYSPAARTSSAPNVGGRQYSRARL